MPSYLIILVLVSAISGMHYFVYRRITKGLLCTPGTRRILSALMVECLFSHVWIRKRRLFVFMAIGPALTASIFSIWNGSRDPVLREYAVPIAGLPQSLRGFTLLHLSDLHFGHSMSAGQWERIVEKVMQQRADMIVITGDIFDREVCEPTPDYCRFLKALRAPQGVWAVPGNHDYYAGIDYVAGALGKAGIRLLGNEWISVTGALQLAGVDDQESIRRQGSGSDLSRALRGMDPDKPILLPAHRPNGFDEAVHRGVDLQLSGHTHAGKIPPTDLLTWFLFLYWHGLYAREKAFIHTGCGTGTWGPRMRLFSRSEIVLLRLTTPGSTAAASSLQDPANR